VKQLETHLGVALFHRQAQGVRLTAAGRQLAPILSAAFESIRQETARLAADAADLHVICPPATSIRWLIPKLDDFQRRHPDIRVRLTTDFHSTVRFARYYDIGFSVEFWPDRARDVEVQPLFPIHLTPACTPDVMTAGAGLRAPQDLARAVLLHERPRRGDWTAWTRHFDLPEIDVAGGYDFPNLDMAVKAALMGTGVVMADLVLCHDELASGALIAPFPEMVCPSPDGSVCLLGARDKWHLPKVVAFRDWALTAATEDRRALGEPLSLGAVPV